MTDPETSMSTDSQRVEGVGAAPTATARRYGVAWFRRTDDPLTLATKIEAFEMSPRETFSQELLDQADGRFLTYDGDRIVVDVDNGRWVYRVTEIDRERGLVTAEWAD